MSFDAPPPELAPGLVISSRFRLERLLGQGGMGSVWVAWHTTLNVEVAVKFIEGALGGRDDVLSRFAQEARTAAKIQSPHVVGILDYGSDEWRRPYIAMELLRGEPLASRVEREARLAPAEVAHLLGQACRGLSRAHALGVVHRDIKPENLFLCADDDGYLVKILDFGIARAESPIGGSSHKTGTGQLLGTPLYMSPEQAFGKSGIDFRSDLYSMAVVAYRCVTGRLPFESDALGELIVAISTLDAPPPSSVHPGVPPSLDAWFARALHKDPQKRFGSAKELAETFAAACNASVAAPGFASPARDVPPAESAAPGTFSGAAATHDDEPVRLPTTRPVGLYAGLAAVALAVVGVSAWTATRAPESAAAATSASAPLAAPPPVPAAPAVGGPAAVSTDAPAPPRGVPLAPAATSAPAAPRGSVTPPSAPGTAPPASPRAATASRTRPPAAGRPGRATQEPKATTPKATPAGNDYGL